MLSAMPSRRHSSAIEVSPRRPSSTMRIFYSVAWCFRVARRMSRTRFSDVTGGQHPAAHQTHLAILIEPTYVLGMIANFNPALLERAWASALPGREAAERNDLRRVLAVALEAHHHSHAPHLADAARAFGTAEVYSCR